MAEPGHHSLSLPFPNSLLPSFPLPPFPAVHFSPPLFFFFPSQCDQTFFKFSILLQYSHPGRQSATNLHCWYCGLRNSSLSPRPCIGTWLPYTSIWLFGFFSTLFFSSHSSEIVLATLPRPSTSEVLICSAVRWSGWLTQILHAAVPCLERSSTRE